MQSKPIFLSNRLANWTKPPPSCKHQVYIRPNTIRRTATHGRPNLTQRAKRSPASEQHWLRPRWRPPAARYTSSQPWDSAIISAITHAVDSRAPSDDGRANTTTSTTRSACRCACLRGRVLYVCVCASTYTPARVSGGRQSSSRLGLVRSGHATV